MVPFHVCGGVTCGQDFGAEIRKNITAPQRLKLRWKDNFSKISQTTMLDVINGELQKPKGR